jgi:hypothetical protein
MGKSGVFSTPRGNFLEMKRTLWKYGEINEFALIRMYA